MTDPVEPREVAAWNEAVRSWLYHDTNTSLHDGVLLLHAGLRLVTALRRTEAGRGEARRLLEDALLDLEVDAPNGAYMPGELPDQIRTYLRSTSGGFHTEEPNP